MIKARGVYAWQARHLWSVEQLIPEGRASKRETEPERRAQRRRRAAV